MAVAAVRIPARKRSRKYIFVKSDSGRSHIFEASAVFVYSFGVYLIGRLTIRSARSMHYGMPVRVCIFGKGRRVEFPHNSSKNKKM